MFDAVHVVVSAVRELNRSQEIGVKPLACTSANIWPHGTSLMNYLRMVSQEWEGRGAGQPASDGGLTVSTPWPLCPLPPPTPPTASCFLSASSCIFHLSLLSWLPSAYLHCYFPVSLFHCPSFAGVLSSSFNYGPS